MAKGSQELCGKSPPLLGPARDPLRLTISAAFLVVAQSDQPSYDPPGLVPWGMPLTGERVVRRLAAILAADVLLAADGPG